MNATYIPLQQQSVTPELPERGRVGMLVLIAAEAAVFTIFCRSLHFLYRQESHRSHAAGRARSADLLQYLPSVEQSDHSSRRQSASRGKRSQFLKVVVLDHRTGRHFSIWNGDRVAQVDLQGRTDRLY